MLLCGECYENIYTKRHANYASFKMLNAIRSVRKQVNVIPSDDFLLQPWSPNKAHVVIFCNLTVYC
jgi:hypothetical protein